MRLHAGTRPGNVGTRAWPRRSPTTVGQRHHQTPRRVAQALSIRTARELRAEHRPARHHAARRAPGATRAYHSSPRAASGPPPPSPRRRPNHSTGIFERSRSAGTADAGETANEIYLGHAPGRDDRGDARRARGRRTIELPDDAASTSTECPPPTSTAARPSSLDAGPAPAGDDSSSTRSTPVAPSSTAAFTYRRSEAGVDVRVPLLRARPPGHHVRPVPGDRADLHQPRERRVHVRRGRGRPREQRRRHAAGVHVHREHGGAAVTVTAPAPDTYTRATTLQFSGTAAPDQRSPSCSGPRPSGRPSEWPGRVDNERHLPAVDGQYTYQRRLRGHGPDVRIFVDRAAAAGHDRLRPPRRHERRPPSTFGAYSTDDPAATFRCRLVGPGRGARTRGCPVAGQRYDGLAAGAYRFSVRATDAAGNSATAPQYLTIARRSAGGRAIAERDAEPHPDAAPDGDADPAAGCRQERRDPADGRQGADQAVRLQPVRRGQVAGRDPARRDDRHQERADPAALRDRGRQGPDRDVLRRDLPGQAGGQDPRPQAHRGAGRLPEEGQGRRRADQEGEEAQAVG